MSTVSTNDRQASRENIETEASKCKQDVSNLTIKSLHEQNNAISRKIAELEKQQKEHGELMKQLETFESKAQTSNVTKAELMMVISTGAEKNTSKLAQFHGDLNGVKTELGALEQTLRQVDKKLSEHKREQLEVNKSLKKLKSEYVGIQLSLSLLVISLIPYFFHGL